MIYHGWAYMLTLRGKGGNRGSPNVEAGKMEDALTPSPPPGAISKTVPAKHAKYRHSTSFALYDSARVSKKYGQNSLLRENGTVLICAGPLWPRNHTDLSS
jgi:hypothetical protein